MGGDGQHTMYVDLVKNEFACSLTSIQRYQLMDTIDDMFNIIKNKKRTKKTAEAVFFFVQ